MTIFLFLGLKITITTLVSARKNPIKYLSFKIKLSFIIFSPKNHYIDNFSYSFDLRSCSIIAFLCVLFQFNFQYNCTIFRLCIVYTLQNKCVWGKHTVQSVRQVYTNIVYSWYHFLFLKCSIK